MANMIVISVDAYLVTLQIVDYEVVEKKIAVGLSSGHGRAPREEGVRG